MGRCAQARPAVNRTDAALEAQVVAVRCRLAQHPWAQIGSDAIAWELAKLEIQAPCTRTIERILARRGLVRPRRRERPKSKGLPYPAPPAKRVGDLHQADLVGPRHLHGGLPFVALSCVDVVRHAAAIEIAPGQTEATLTPSLIGVWERLGVPRRLQLDNGMPFVPGAASLGEIVRVATTRERRRSSSLRASRGATAPANSSTTPSTSASFAQSASTIATASPTERSSSRASTTQTTATARPANAHQTS